MTGQTFRQQTQYFIYKSLLTCFSNCN